MTFSYASRDPGQYAVDHGHEIAAIGCDDETDNVMVECLDGVRQAEHDLWRASGGNKRNDGDEDEDDERAIVDTYLAQKASRGRASRRTR